MTKKSMTKQDMSFRSLPPPTTMKSSVRDAFLFNDMCDLDVPLGWGECGRLEGVARMVPGIVKGEGVVLGVTQRA